MPAATPAPPAPRLTGLEALRFVAALCVMGLHTPVIYGHGLPQPFRKGYLGVDLFFMLSGFVMAKSFERKPPAAQPVLRFSLDRYARMWPVMAVGGLIGWPLLHLRLPDDARFWPIALANLLLLPVSFQREAYPLDVPAWTILYILLGNLLHRLLFWRLGTRALALLIAASALAMALVGAHAGSFDVGARPENMALALPRLVLAYAIGMALRRGWGDSPPFAPPAWLALAAVPALMLSAWALALTGWLFDMAFVVLACPLIIAGAMRARRGAALATFCGAWAFPLYAVHYPLILRLRMNGAAPAVACVAALIVAALVTVIERAVRSGFARARIAG